jgi:hypothetical protein
MVGRGHEEDNTTEEEDYPAMVESIPTEVLEEVHLMVHHIAEKL